MALQLKNRVRAGGFRALAVCVIASALTGLVACAARPVARYSQAAPVQGDSSNSVVFEGEGVLLARGGEDAPLSNWRDASLSIREVKNQWEDAMWPTQRRHSLWRSRRFTLPRHAETVLFFERESYRYQREGGYGRGW